MSQPRYEVHGPDGVDGQWYIVEIAMLAGVEHRRIVDGDYISRDVAEMAVQSLIGTGWPE